MQNYYSLELMHHYQHAKLSKLAIDNKHNS